MLANNGQRDFAGHRLCVKCWNSSPKLSNPKPGANGRIKRPTVVKRHACEGGACECPCRVMELERIAKPKRDQSSQLELPKGETIAV